MPLKRSPCECKKQALSFMPQNKIEKYDCAGNSYYLEAIAIFIPCLGRKVKEGNNSIGRSDTKAK